VFTSVLVANRGEIAVRIIGTLRRLGIRAVAVYSDADAGARHVEAADTAVRLGPAPARASYLDVDRVIAAALASGAEAVHPGYGFLSENPALARACAAHWLVFVGPPVAAVETMGDKIRAKQLVAAAGVPVVPGTDGRGLSDRELAESAPAIGFPVLIKPSAGGGGKGMRLVSEPDGLAAGIAAARREALGAFGDDTLLLERYLDTPRHLEIQVLADAHGTVVHLGERECSLQRRHQKIVEEAPAPRLEPTVRSAMGAAAVAVARSCGYEGAGTVEFIASAHRPGEFFFLEMNTRLQVEHPVTEMVYGVDLVEQQLRVAAGERLAFAQDDLVARGHAIEARVYAEDPAAGFLPTGGTVLRLVEPTGPGVRVDSGLAPGTVVGSEYDPMLAKVIAHGADRDEALRRLDTALAATTVLGVPTNLGYLRALLADPDVRAGRLDTGLVERTHAGLLGTAVPDAVVAAAALLALSDERPEDPWQLRTGWRPSGAADVGLTVRLNRARLPVTARWEGGWRLTVDGAGPVAAAVRRRPGEVVVERDGVITTVQMAAGGPAEWWLGLDGDAWLARVEEPWESSVGHDAAGAHGPVLSPMPGLLSAVLVAEGDLVGEGQPLATVEAMKMEHTLRAPVDGVVAAVHATAGRQVALNEPIVTLGPADHPA